jgi:DNA invertase Pin-like site-specific DNA recombinase
MLVQKKTKAACYVRVSRSDQNSQMQTDETAELIERRGWVLHERYADEGISGSHDRRPGFRAMMEAARKRKFDVLVVFRADRLFRSLRDLLMTLDELASLGIGFVSCNEPFDTTTASGKLLVTLIGAFAEFERSVLIERTRSGLDSARRRGVRLGRPRVELDVAKAQRLRAQGRSFRDVAKAMGVKVATLHRALKAAREAVN